MEIAVDDVFVVMINVIFLMRFTPEEWEIVLRMAKNCLNKPNLNFHVFSPIDIQPLCHVF